MVMTQTLRERILSDLAMKGVLLFLDFDGTLAPIADRPEDARLPEETRKTLALLSKVPDVRIAVVSGRSLESVKEKTNIRGIAYAGNHGLEIRGPGFRHHPPLQTAYRKALRRLRYKLPRWATGHSGVLVEDKGLTISVHYRNVAKESIRSVKWELDYLVALYARSGVVSIREGKKVLEVRPAVSWGKGEAVRWLMNRREWLPARDEIVPVYIGDDATDEDAFAELGGAGITVFVGRRRNTKARYRLADTEAVFEFLRRLWTIKKDVSRITS
jgi:trehalose 6-phosphate phosphatase